MLRATMLGAGLLLFSCAGQAQSITYKISVLKITAGAVPISAFSLQFSSTALLLAAIGNPTHLQQQSGFAVSGAPQPGYTLADALLINTQGQSQSFTLTFTNASGSAIVLSLQTSPPSLLNITGLYQMQVLPSLMASATAPPVPGNFGLADVSIAPPPPSQPVTYTISVAAIPAGGLPIAAFTLQFSSANYLLPLAPDSVDLVQQTGFTVTGAPQAGYSLASATMTWMGIPQFALTFKKPGSSDIVINLNPNSNVLLTTSGTYPFLSMAMLNTPPPAVVSNLGVASLSIGGPISAPVLIRSTNAIQVVYRASTGFPPLQQILLTSSGVNIGFTASPTDPWLSVSPGAGATPAALTITFNPVGLLPGTYQGAIRLSAPAAVNSNDSIPVTLTVINEGGPPAPVTYRITNSASYAAPDAPNGTIAQGSLFVIFGAFMGPTALVQSGYPLSTNLSGTSVRATVGSVSTDALLEYTSAGQLAAILPSSTPAGNGTVTVSYNGIPGAPFPFTISSASFGTYSVTSNGRGQGIVTGADYRLKTFAAPAMTGEIVILWGTGLGAITGDESNPPAADNKFTPQVLIGNLSAKVLYAGRSSCCGGLDQINFQVPAGITGCFVPVAVRSGSVTGNFTSLPISSTGAPCVDTVGFAPDLLSRAAAGSSVKAALIAIGPVRILQYLGFPLYQSAALRLSTVLGTPVAPRDVRKLLRAGPSERRAAMAELMKKYRIHSLGQVRRMQAEIRAVIAENAQGAAATFIDLSNLGVVAPQFATDFPTPGSCTVLTGIPTAASGAGPKARGLDAGSQLSLSTPSGTSTLANVSSGEYEVLLGSGSQVATGAYRVSGTAGKDVGSFSALLNVNNTLVWQNASAITSVDRTQPLTVTWTGGPVPGHVMFGGFSNDAPGGSVFVCVEDAQKGSLTVPSYVLSVLPASKSGYLFLGPHPFETTFTAPGIDAGFFANFGNSAVMVPFR